MPYRYLDNIAIADAAFEAWGGSLENMLIAASDATLNIMVGDLAAIRPREFRHFRVLDPEIDMLLFQLLQEIVYYKDAEQLLLRIRTVRVEQSEHGWAAYIEAAGEQIDPQRHDLVVDIKAITLHNLSVRQTSEGWTATVTVDV
jgi:SHS2 domain-containing protein